MRQLDFDELISHSLAALQRVSQSEDAIESDVASVDISGLSTPSAAQDSIDDFLSNYRQGSSSIYAFVSQAEETMQHTDPPKTQPFYHQQRSCTCTESPFENQWVAPPIPVHAAPLEDSSQVLNPDPKISSNFEQDVSKCKSGNTPQRKRKVVLSPEEREELRRSKNREYQRRFREKKMRLQVQGLSASSPPPRSACGAGVGQLPSTPGT